LVLFSRPVILNGTIYAQKASLTLSGNGQSSNNPVPRLSFVVATMTISGNGVANSPPPPNGPDSAGPDVTPLLLDGLLETPTPQLRTPAMVSWIAREEGALLPDRQPVVFPGLVHRGALDKGMRDWMTDPLDDALLDQLVGDQV
jgi:hypothetical protein